MKITILDDYAVRFYHPQKGKSLLIRVLEPHYKEIGIPYSSLFQSRYRRVCSIYFDDVDLSVQSRDVKQTFTYFDKTLAGQILEFVKGENIEELVIHCHKGKSRSASIGVGVSQKVKLGTKLKRIRSQHVFSI